MNIRPGLNLSDLVVKENANNGSSGDTHYPYGQKLSVRIGAEAEFVLNFGKNKWAIIFQPAYQYYKVNSTTQNINTVASYKTLEMTPGVRYYMFLKPGSKLYLTGSLFYDIPFNAYVDLGNIDFSVKPRINAAFSVGYQYIDKFSIELKYALPSQIIDYYLYFGARLNTTSLIFAYRLF